MSQQNQSTTVNKPQIIGLQTVSSIYQESLNHNIDFNDYQFTLESFIQTGCISYFLGLDYMNNPFLPTEQGLKNISSRLLMNKISYEKLTEVHNFIYNINKEEFDKLKQFGDDIKEKFESTPFNETNDFIESKIISLFSDLGIVKTRYVEDIDNRFLSGKRLTYHDLIVFINTFYEVIELDMNHHKKYVDILNDEVFKKLIKEASIYFELQKFHLIFVEALQIWKENSDTFNLYLEFFDNILNKEITNDNFLSEFENAFSVISDKIDETKNTVNSIEVNEPELNSNNDNSSLTEEIVDNPLQKPEDTFKSIFSDTNLALTTTGVLNLDWSNNFDDFIKLIEFLLNDEDLVQPVYTLIMELNKLIETGEKELIDSSSIFNSKDFKIKLEQYLKHLKVEYSEQVSNYISEYDKELIDKLYPEINKIIELLIVDGTENKSILLSQLDSNLLFTPKHIHQILEIIDEQKIQIYNIDNFIDFKMMWDSNEFSELKSIISKSTEFEIIEVKQRFLQAFNKVIK